MGNTLDLDPEWGAIDLLEEVEATFGFRVAKEEAEHCATVGGLYDIVCTHSPVWDGQDGGCSSSMVFYRLRRALSPDDKRLVAPSTPLIASGLTPSQLFKVLADDSGLRLPSHGLTWLGVTGGFVLSGGMLATIVALLTGHWIVSGIAALVALAGLLFLKADPGRFPAGIVTVGDLVRRTVPLNVTYLREAGGRPSDRWTVIVALAAEHGLLPPDEIGPDTYLHRKSLKLATAR